MADEIVGRKDPYTMTDEIYQELTAIKNNPGLVIEHAYSTLLKATNGDINVPNPTTPFSYLMECAALQATTLHDAHEINYRNQYPRLATKYEHLYNHMFDEHYIGRFATPGRAKFELYFNKFEIQKELELSEEYKGYKRIVIPRGSYITTQDYIFTLLYPIEITQLSHGEIEIFYITDEKDPVQTLRSNIVEWGYCWIGDNEYIRIRPTLYNVKLIQVSETVMTSGFTKTWTLQNKFCHCRVYQRINGRIEELTTTHSDVVYDQNKCTAKLRYLENQVEVIIPPIYHHNGLLGSEIIVEFYTTVGKIEEPINDYDSDAFSYQWGNLPEKTADALYVTPLEQITQPIVRAMTMLQGGTDGESFEQLRDRVVNAAGYSTKAITPAQIELGLSKLGYDIIKSRDTLTSRSYLASRALPVNKDDEFTAGAAASMETLKISINDLAFHPHVRDNVRRLTITPEMLFKYDGGIVKHVPILENPKYYKDKVSLDEYVAELNKLQYMYTPFYYVMDPTNYIFNFRAYYMDSPSIDDQVFIANNRTSGFSVSSEEIVILKFEEEVYNELGKKEIVEGYKVRVRTRSTEAYRELPYENLFAQLSILPHKDKNYATINGVLLGTATNEDTELEEYIWEFTLKTNWDITDDHNLILEDFYMYLNEGRKFEFPLTGEMFFAYGVVDTQVSGYNPDNVDKYVNRQILDSDEVIAISVDKVTYRFGWYLNQFWSNGVPVQGDKRYQTYKADVPRVYTKDVYDIDANGIFLVEDAGLKVIHRAGDPVMDEHGNPIYIARKGDIVLDSNGKPLLELDRSTEYLIDIMMVDGIYYFATSEEDIKYRNNIGKTVKDWVIEDLEELSGQLLENTRLMFYPKRTMGEIELIVEGGKELKEPTRQSFSVVYYMNESNYQDQDIRAALTEKTKEIINTHLTRTTVTMSDIISDLNAMGEANIIGCHMDKFGSADDRKYTAFTVKHISDRCSIRRKIEAQSDNTLKVIEDVDVIFVNHQIIDELKN